MSLVINTNIGSLNAQRSLNSSNDLAKTAMQRLSSGKKINSAADDAAGFAIVERQTSQIRGLNMAIKNANDGLSMISTVDQATGDVTDILQRLRELNIQAQNGTNGNTDLTYLRQESEALVEEIDRIANHTTFNNQRLMDGSLAEKAYAVLGYPWSYVGSGAAEDTSAAGSVVYVSQNGSVTTTINNDAGNIETAKSSAAKVNATTETSGLKARARTEGRLNSWGGDTRSIALNGVSITWENDGSSPAADIAAINSVSGQTGVIAESANDGMNLYLIDEDGDDIIVQSEGPNNNLTVMGVQAFSRRLTMVNTYAWGQTLDSSGTDTIRLTGTTMVSANGYATATTSSGTYAFTEQNIPGAGATLQVGTEKGQSVSVHLASFDTDKLGGQQVVRTSIDVYGGAGTSLAGVPINTSGAHGAASFRVIQLSTGASYDLDLGAGPFYYRNDYTWGAQLVSAGLADKLQVSSYEVNDLGNANYLNALRFTSMEGFGDFDVVWSDAHGYSLPSGVVDGQSIINSSDANHTQIAHTGTLSTMSGLSLNEQLKVIDTALDQVASRRAELGATTNRLAYTISNLSSVSENTQAARSQIQDADYAVESARLTKAQLLQTSASAMIAQANAAGSMVMQLIR